MNQPGAYYQFERFTTNYAVFSCRINTNIKQLIYVPRAILTESILCIGSQYSFIFNEQSISICTRCGQLKSLHSTPKLYCPSATFLNIDGEDK
jgi:hypothetical protein